MNMADLQAEEERKAKVDEIRASLLEYKVLEVTYGNLMDYVDGAEYMATYFIGMKLNNGDETTNFKLQIRIDAGHLHAPTTSVGFIPRDYRGDWVMLEVFEGDVLAHVITMAENCSGVMVHDVFRQTIDYMNHSKIFSWTKKRWVTKS